MNITYKFIPQGQSYIPAANKCEIVLDVGGINEGLVFDHHFPGSPNECAAMLVYNNRLRLDPLKIEKNVTIVIHKDPDFDCSCAAWLVTNYLQNGDFPSGSEWVVNYASIVDFGNLTVRKEYYLVPASVMYAFYKSADENNNLNTIGQRNEWILKKAFELMDWCTQNLAKNIQVENDDKRIYDLMFRAKIFEKENQFLKEDRKKYETELANNNIVTKIQDFHLFNKFTLKPESVAALMYTIPPSSSLTKYWARNDGYLLTIIPIPCDNRWDDAIWKPNDFSANPNRVIISIPPETSYTLKPLAKQLERAECEIEKRILGDRVEIKRTRTVKRIGYENEKWVTNNDPWYDGSAHNYSIVDSPSSLSFLSTQRIISIAMNHTRYDIFNTRINIIYPVLLKGNKKIKNYNWEGFFDLINNDYKNYGVIWDKHNNKSKIGEYNNNLNEYFFESVKSFLNTDNNNPNETLWFRKKDSIESYANKEKIEDILIQEEKINEFAFPINCIHDIRIACFTSKFGFIIFSVDFWNLMSNDIPEILKILNNSKKAFSLFFGLSEDLLEYFEPVFMVFMEFDGNKINNIDIGQDVFAACSFFDDTISLSDGSSEINWMEKMLLRINAGNVFGFSRNCMTFASINRIKQIECGENKSIKKSSKFLEAYWTKFNGPWVNELILALHQHFSMISMKTRLGMVDINDKYILHKLQSEFVDFTANSCFAQVTSDPTGAELYNRWKELLNLDDLYQEVNSQIAALNDHVTSSIQNMFTIISFVFFPMTLLLSIIQFVDSTKEGVSEKIGILTSICLGCFIFYKYLSWFQEKVNSLKKFLIDIFD